ncbi:hypothetical protein ACQKWADRAFT_213408 [Trichoderma austrokoningii]
MLLNSRRNKQQIALMQLGTWLLWPSPLHCLYYSFDLCQLPCSTGYEPGARRTLITRISPVSINTCISICSTPNS